MAQSPHTTASTKAPANHAASGFPPFDTHTYPSQIFWLTITFGLLFVVLWRVAGPRINAAIGGRRSAINGAIVEANKARSEAETIHEHYQRTLTQARAKAHAIAEEARHSIGAEIAKAKVQADIQSRQALADADEEIAVAQQKAMAEIAHAARDSAILIVHRLTGDRISPEQAQEALGN